MRERTIYFLFTDTGTYLSKAINYCTKQSLNHVSIAFEPDLSEVYSFGRKRPKNPFIGGFVVEDIQSEFMKNSNCAIYSYTITESECEAIIQNIKEIEARKEMYRYNFIGLIGILLHIKINRKNAYFCSQFVATILKDLEKFQLSKPPHFITPADIRMHEDMQLIYQGRLGDYQSSRIKKERKLVIGEQTLPKQSFIFLLSSKVKRFVIR
ncbi:hypothetical protein CIL05_02030 [Virgibacillus profundi]|uniref:Uncharacterized protein n=1 Tax=Virgibacillus profundi TaxID=2024555 RepID=A0A2A2IJG0_9BACI|nr:hypothetical protein [Virgibacillus profundi]PAV31456.1 hypothetical protein CIL05_02030 [Virgibacillus profundi]PXY55642.1 hypothetical protein CIT14_02040 [Virgibacillus profundi]